MWPYDQARNIRASLVGEPPIRPGQETDHTRRWAAFYTVKFYVNAMALRTRPAPRSHAISCRPLAGNEPLSSYHPAHYQNNSTAFARGLPAPEPFAPLPARKNETSTGPREEGARMVYQPGARLQTVLRREMAGDVPVG